MNNKRRHAGLTLTELTVVVAAAAALAFLAMPAIKTFFNSLGTVDETKTVIGAALSAARTIAVQQQRYAGIRFQCIYDPNTNPLKASQYMIFIINEPDNTNLVNGYFKAVEGIKPIKLSDNIGVADLLVRQNWGDPSITNSQKIIIANLNDSGSNMQPVPGSSSSGNINIYINDTMTFSIIFSPAGKLIIRQVRTRNRDAQSDPDNGAGTAKFMDDIFNSPINITFPDLRYKAGMFIQDDYAGIGLGGEYSRNNFVIFDRQEFSRMNAADRYNYINDPSKLYYINPYTGTIIDKNQ